MNAVTTSIEYDYENEYEYELRELRRIERSNLPHHPMLRTYSAAARSQEKFC